jgi:hypothetical protein
MVLQDAVKTFLAAIFKLVIFVVQFHIHVIIFIVTWSGHLFVIL